MGVRALTLVSGVLFLVAGLACGSGEGIMGLGGPGAEPVDPAEQLRREGDFLRAEDMLKARIEADPSDHVAHMIFGDVKVSRGQAYRKKWARNLRKARQSYKDAVMLAPTECRYWERLAFTVAASAEDPEVRTTQEFLADLPLETGWFECPSPALLVLEEARLPGADTQEQVREELGADATRFQLAAAANPHLIKAYQRLDLSSLPWGDPVAEATAQAGGYLVIFEGPVRARGMGGAQDRTIDGPEWVRIHEVLGDKISFRDTKVRSRAREDAIVLADGCPGTSWNLGADGAPLGYCTPGPYDPRRTRLHDPDLLQVASASHWDQPTIDTSVIDRGIVVQGTVECLGGPVGRLMVDKATCRARFYRAATQLRTIPLLAGRVAATEGEAERMVDAYGMGALYGYDVGRALAEGRRAEGMPWSLFRQVETEVRTCTGRRLFQRAWFDDGHIVFYCNDSRENHKFVDLAYTGIDDDS